MGRNAARRPLRSDPEPDAPAPLQPERLRAWALRYLGRFASSSGNLARVMGRKATRLGYRLDAPMLQDLTDDLTRLGLIDDAAFARQRVSSLQARGRSAPRLRMTLASKGVAREDAELALTGYDELGAATAFARRRRVGPYRTGEPDTMRERLVMRRAGFSSEVTRRVLQAGSIEELTRDELA